MLYNIGILHCFTLAFIFQVIALSSSLTTVDDTVDIIFFGGNKGRHVEYKGLKKVCDSLDFACKIICAEKESEDLPDGVFYTNSQKRIQLRNKTGLKKYQKHLEDLGLDYTKASSVISWMSNLDPNRKGRGDIARLIDYLIKAENGDIKLRRLIVSMHGSMYGFFSDNIGRINLVDLNILFTIFPKAAAQIEHVMVSSCQSGHKPILISWNTFLPNLKTIVGYVGSSPSYTQGSIAHMKEWAKSTAPGVDYITEMNRDKLLSKLSKYGLTYNIAIWGPNKEYQASKKVLETLDQGRNLMMRWKVTEPDYLRFYNGVYDCEDSQYKSRLNELYSLATQMAVQAADENSAFRKAIEIEASDIVCENMDDHMDDLDIWCSDPANNKRVIQPEILQFKLDEFEDAPRILLCLRFYQSVKHGLAEMFEEELGNDEEIKKFVELPRTTLTEIILEMAKKIDSKEEYRKRIHVYQILEKFDYTIISTDIIQTWIANYH